MKQMEKVYKSEALTKGWGGINQNRTWWFDLSDVYHKRYSLDGMGVPIYWDDDVYDTEETRVCTGDSACTLILSDKDGRKALVLINRDLDHVLILGVVEAEVTWEAYNGEGLWAVKKQCPGMTLEAVIIDPKIKTLEKFKVVKAVIKKVIETRDIKKGAKDEPAAKQDGQHQGNPAAA